MAEQLRKTSPPSVPRPEYSVLEVGSHCRSMLCFLNFSSVHEPCSDMRYLMFATTDGSKFDLSFKNTFGREEYITRTDEEKMKKRIILTGPFMSMTKIMGTMRPSRALSTPSPHVLRPFFAVACLNFLWCDAEYHQETLENPRLTIKSTMIFLVAYSWLAVPNQISKFLLPGALAAAVVMLGVLHAKRMYNDKKLACRKKGERN